MSCPSPEELSRFEHGQLSEARNREVGRHVAQCELCRQRLSRTSAADESLDHRLRWACVVDPSLDELDQCVDRIFAKVRQESPGSFREPPAELHADDKLKSTNSWHVSEPLAQGGLGRIWTARDDFGRTAAVKVILGSKSNDPEIQQRFENEARRTARLAHPGIVTVYSAGRTRDGLPFYAMYLVDGVTLGQAIEHGAPEWPLRQLLRRFIDVCHAMEYAHENGVIHRDLKPNNVLLGKHGETIVIDWGLSRELSPVNEPAGPGGETPSQPLEESEPLLTQYGMRLGTPAYMSPEQAMGKIDQVGKASDIYSLGATLYEILAGCPAFQGTSSHEICEAVGRGDFERPRLISRRVPAALEAICLHAMALAPEHRYQDVKAMRLDVQAWLDHERVSVFREPLVSRFSRWIRRHRTVSGIIAAAVLIGIVALAFDFTRTQAANRQLAEAYGELRQRLDELAAAHETAGKEFYEQLKMSESLREYSAALQLRQEQYQTEATDANQYQLAIAWNRVALTRHKTADLSGAKDGYKRAMFYTTGLLERFPDDPNYLRLKLNILGNRGMTQSAEHGFDDAIETYEEALLVNQGLLAVTDRATWLQEDARLNGNLADAIAGKVIWGGDHPSRM
ncbi:MAG: serine/threonine-protein kinase [Pirellulaceae bacterium]